jgi:hypothetical protein
MKKILSLFCLAAGLLQFHIMPVYGADHITLQDQTVGASEVQEHFAGLSITAGPNYTVQSGAQVTLRSGRTIILKPGVTIEKGAKFAVHIFGEDTTGPEVISGYPQNGAVIPAPGGPLSMLITFGDSGSGVRSVILLNSENENITSQATVAANTIEYIIANPTDGDYVFTLELEDNLGNITRTPITFRVDGIIPVTTVSMAGGSYDDPISIDLTASEPATIYYSTDGYPPYAGADNTFSATAPITGLAIERTMNLQFFAVDPAGNVEEIQSEVYVIGEVPGLTISPTAVYNPSQNRVELTWTALPDFITGYHVYRCSSQTDKAIMEQSLAGGYPPPNRFRLTPAPLSADYYHDTAIVPGASYWYGVTVINNSIEGVVSPPMAVEIDVNAPAANPADAIARATVWLEKTQHFQGHWGEKASTRILATSQVLNAFNRADMDNAALRKAQFYLRGQHADNNDFLSRQIMTLHGYGQNVDQQVNRLIAQAYISGTSIYGWGMQKRFLIDAIDTALGGNAVACASAGLEDATGTTLNNYAWYQLKNASTLQSTESGRFSWVSDQAGSVYPSAYVYWTIDNFQTNDFDVQWIKETQATNGNGAFGSGLIDTAAGLLWLELTDTEKTDAVNFLVSRQSINGSWNDDPYVTGLCLEALLK